MAPLLLALQALTLALLASHGAAAFESKGVWASGLHAGQVPNNCICAPLPPAYLLLAHAVPCQSVVLAVKPSWELLSPSAAQVRPWRSLLLLRRVPCRAQHSRGPTGRGWQEVDGLWERVVGGGGGGGCHACRSL